MKKLLIIALLLVAPCWATVTVTGHLVNPSSGAVSNSFVRFELVNCGTNSPKVAAGTIVAPYYDFKPAADGSVSGVLYPNTDITCGGSATSLWKVTYYYNGTASKATPLTYSITANFNLDSPPTPSTVVVVPPNPIHGIRFREAWNSGTTYAAYDVVTYGGSTYFALAVSLNVTPGTDGTKWTIIAQKGDPGSGGGVAAWGSISGTLSSQSDLAAALAGKQNVGSYEVPLTFNAPLSRAVNAISIDLSAYQTISAANTALALKLNTSAFTRAGIVALWTTCLSGYLKYDGTCDTPSGAGTLATVATTGSYFDLAVKPTAATLNTIFGFAPMNPANALSELPDKAVARTTLGLGSAASMASTAFESSLNNPAGNGYLLSSTTGGVRSWVAPFSLTAIAINTALGYAPMNPGNALAELPDKAAARTTLGLGSIATMPSTSFELALGNPTSNGYILSSTTAGVRSWIPPPSGTLTAIAINTALGFAPMNPDNALSELPDKALARTNLGLGSSATSPSTFYVYASNVDTDVTLAANSDIKVPSQRAIKAYVLANSATGAQPFMVGNSYTGLPATGFEYYRAIIADTSGTAYGAAITITIPANCSGTKVNGNVNASTGVTVLLKKNGTTICTGTVAAGAQNATFTSTGGPYTFTSGDVISLVGGTADPTWANPVWAIAGSR